MNSFKGKPIIEYVDEVEVSSRRDVYKPNPVEAYWVEQFRQWGFHLMNGQHNIAKDYRSNRKTKRHK
jgi:hypothetical protein